MARGKAQARQPKKNKVKKETKEATVDKDDKGSQVEKETSPEPKETEMAEKRSKRADDTSDSDSGPDDVKPPTKVAKSGIVMRNKLKNDEGDTFFELDRNKRVTIREFKGKIYIDIREYYEKEGKYLPGKKGIALNATQWIKVKDLISDIDDAVQQLA